MFPLSGVVIKASLIMTDYMMLEDIKDLIVVNDDEQIAKS